MDYVKGYKLHKELVRILTSIVNLGYDIDFISLGRSFAHHIQVYKDIARKEGKEFDINDVPLDSRHLPTFDTIDLRAVDFRLYKNGKAIDGDKIKELIIEVKGGVKVGIGVGKKMCHLDIDRDKEARWRY